MQLLTDEIRLPGLVAGRPGVQPDAPFALYVADLAADLRPGAG